MASRSIINVRYLFLLAIVVVLSACSNKVNQPAAPPTPQPPAYKEEWGTYMTRGDKAEIVSILVDLGRKGFAPDATRPNLVTVAVKIRKPTDDGLTPEEEFEPLNKIEDRIAAEMLSRHEAIYPGRMMYKGMRLLYFYVANAESCKETVERAMKDAPEYKYTVAVEQDSEWKAYFGALYPSAQERQSMENQNVVARLLQQGDKLEKKRPVTHWIYFRDTETADKFLEKIKGKGFEAVKQRSANDEKDMSYVVILKRIDSVDLLSVDEYTLELWQFAEELGGEYDGWETEVMK